MFKLYANWQKSSLRMNLLGGIGFVVVAIVFNVVWVQYSSSTPFALIREQWAPFMQMIINVFLGAMITVFIMNVALQKMSEKHDAQKHQQEIARVTKIELFRSLVDYAADAAYRKEGMEDIKEIEKKFYKLRLFAQNDVIRAALNMFKKVIVANSGASKDAILDFAEKCNLELYAAWDFENNQKVTELDNKEIAHLLRIFQTRILGFRCKSSADNLVIKKSWISDNASGKSKWNLLRLNQVGAVETWVTNEKPPAEANYLFLCKSRDTVGIVGFGHFTVGGSLQILNSVSLGQQIEDNGFLSGEGDLLIPLMTPKDAIGNQELQANKSYDMFIEQFVDVIKKMDMIYKSAFVRAQKYGNIQLERLFNAPVCFDGETAFLNLIANAREKRKSKQFCFLFSELKITRFVTPLYKEYEKTYNGRSSWLSFELERKLQDWNDNFSNIFEKLSAIKGKEVRKFNVKLLEDGCSDVGLTFEIESVLE